MVQRNLEANSSSLEFTAEKIKNTLPPPAKVKGSGGEPTDLVFRRLRLIAQFKREVPRENKTSKQKQKNQGKKIRMKTSTDEKEEKQFAQDDLSDLNGKRRGGKQLQLFPKILEHNRVITNTNLSWTATVEETDVGAAIKTKHFSFAEQNSVFARFVRAAAAGK